MIRCVAHTFRCSEKDLGQDKDSHVRELCQADVSPRPIEVVSASVHGVVICKASRERLSMKWYSKAKRDSRYKTED